MNLCQAGHLEHDRRSAPTYLGDLTVYDWDKYKGYNGYCTGQDDISQTLIKYGKWEHPETLMIKKLLNSGDRNCPVWDFGAHIGWYSILAGQLGYPVAAFEGDAENVDVLKINAKNRGVEKRLMVFPEWVGGTSKKIGLQEGMDIELVKADVEGNERFVIAMIDDWLKARRIKNLFIEISPCFNDSYPALVAHIEECGYRAYTTPDLQPFDHNYDFEQTNLLFQRK